MKYEIELTEIAEQHIFRFRKSGQKQLLKKIEKLINELENHPKTGTVKPEQLKHSEIPTWSIRIDKQHRLVY